MIIIFIILATNIFYFMNKLLYSFCIVKEIPEEKQSSFLKTSNILTLILLINSFIEISFI